MRPSHWLKVLTTYVLSVEVFSIFKEDWVVAGFMCSFSPPE
jgi:hypothetical protein